MSRNNHFERFESHTHLKHFLLTVYLKKWANILVTHYRRVWFIDAFAGCGRDDAGAPGSPLIAAQIAREIAAERFAAPAGVELPPRTGMHVIAVESNATRAGRLAENLAPYMTTEPRVAFGHEGVLQDFLADLQPKIRHDPVLYFLDPFGVDGLDAAMLHQLFDGRRREVLMLFSDGGAVRLAGQVEARVPTREALLAEQLHTKSLFGEHGDAEAEAAARADVERRLAGYTSSEQSRAIMTRAYGSDEWVAVTAKTAPSRRREALLDLYCDVLRRAGATHVLRFQVTTNAGLHKYTLLHASTHHAAFAAMKEAMHAARLSRPRGAEQPVLPSLFDASGGEDATSPTDTPSIEAAASDEARQVLEAVEQIARHFAGKADVRWDHGHAGRGSVRQYALHDTPLLIHQFDALKDALRRRGYLTKARPITYAFPNDAQRTLAKAS
jgi:three-Cys-motif partner protein